MNIQDKKEYIKYLSNLKNDLFNNITDISGNNNDLIKYEITKFNNILESLMDIYLITNTNNYNNNNNNYNE